MNANANQNDPKSSLFMKITSSLGPGLIIAATIFGAGSIIISSRAGTTVGYGYLWVLLVAAIFMVTFTRISASIGCYSKDSLLEQIEKNYSRKLSILCGISVCLICTGFQTGNNINTGIALNSLFPILSVKMWIIVSFIIVMVLIWKSASFYQLLERIMTILVLIMIICFASNVLFFISDIRVPELARGLFPSKVTNWQLIVSMSATTFSIAGASCQSYLVQGKNWGKPELAKAQKDASTGIIILIFITAVILITAATVLPANSKITSVPSIAALLKPIFGNFANTMFLTGFFAAAISTLIANAVIGATFLSDAFKLGKTFNDFWVKMFTSIIIAFGGVVGLLFGSNPIELTIMAQGATVLGGPFVAFIIFLLSNNKNVLGENTNKPFTNIICVLAILWLTFLSINQILLWIGIRI